jgi:hypothetical protein
VVGLIVGFDEGRLVGLNEGLISKFGVFVGQAVLDGAAVIGALVGQKVGE